MKPDTFRPKVAQNQRTYRKDKPRSGPGRARGSRVGGAVFTEELVKTVRAMREGLGMGAEKIRKELLADGIEVNIRTLRAVLGYQTWSWVK